MSATINVTHANLKTPVAIMRSAVFAVYNSAANKATHVVSIAGSFLPVLESKDEVVNALNLTEITPKEKKENVNQQ